MPKNVKNRSYFRNKGGKTGTKDVFLSLLGKYCPLEHFCKGLPVDRVYQLTDLFKF